MWKSLISKVNGYEICCTATTLIIKKEDKVIKIVKSAEKEVLEEEKLSFIESLQGS